MRFISFLAVCFINLFFFATAQASLDKAVCENADKLLTNASFLTLNVKQPIANSMAITKERIVGVGEQNELLKACRGPHTEIIDMKGAVITPGFIDTYSHFLLYGWLFENALDLSPTNPLQRKD